MDGVQNLQDIAQWLAFAVLISGLWWRIKQRDLSLEALTKWRTNMERDVKEVNTRIDNEVKVIDERLDRHETHDSRLFNRLDTITEALKGVSERLVRIESRMNGG